MKSCELRRKGRPDRRREGDDVKIKREASETEDDVDDGDIRDESSPSR